MRKSGSRRGQSSRRGRSHLGSRAPHRLRGSLEGEEETVTVGPSLCSYSRGALGPQVRFYTVDPMFKKEAKAHGAGGCQRRTSKDGTAQCC